MTVHSTSAAPSVAMAHAGAGYLPRASPGGGRSTTNPPGVVELLGGKVPGSWRNSMPKVAYTAVLR